MPPKHPDADADADACPPLDGLFAAYEPAEVHRPLPPASLLVRTAGPADVAALAPLAQARDDGEFERHELVFQRQIGAGEDEWYIAAATVDETIVGFGRVNRFTRPPEAAANTSACRLVPGGTRRRSRVAATRCGDRVDAASAGLASRR